MINISIIIPVYNEIRDIVDCLNSLKNQTRKDFEVIVVDDGSDDKTYEFLSRLKINDLKLLILRQNHLGAGSARNFGSKKAKGKILVFVDADMTFDPKFLSCLVGPIQKGLVFGTFSKNEYVANWNNLWARCWNIQENWEERRRHRVDFPDEQPVFRAILKSEFDKVGGFTPGGYDDDWSLYKKLGYMATNTSGAVFYHKNPATLSEIFNHAKWVGKRKYKLGILGDFISLLRSSLPMSLVIGIIKGILNLEIAFVIFKIVYDCGVFVGILEHLFLGKSSK